MSHSESTKSDYRRFYILLIIISLPFIIIEELLHIQLLPGLPLSALMFVAPILAVLVLYHGNNNELSLVIRNLFRFRTSKSILILAVSVFLMPLIVFISFIYAKITNAINENITISILNVIALLVVFLIAAVGEEFAWTGFLLKKYTLESKYKYYIFIPIAYIAWHLIPFIQTNHSLTWIIGQLIFSFVFRILIIQIYIVSGKMGLLSVFMHATYNLAWQAFPVNGSMYNPWSVSLISIIIAIILELSIRRKMHLTIAST